VTESSDHRVVTERLVLRRVTEADVEDYYRLFTDPEVTRYLPTRGQPIPWGSFEGLVGCSDRHWSTHGYGVWVVCDLEDGSVIGQCGLRFLDENGETEVLYAYARPWWGKGIATEAAVAALAFGFERTGLRRIVAYAVPENQASTRVMEKLGMVLEEPVEIFGLSTVRYAISAEAWAGRTP
jgi:[ribosomal protein S5]-alanine N-acetyltransferase